MGGSQIKFEIMVSYDSSGAIIRYDHVYFSKIILILC